MGCVRFLLLAAAWPAPSAIVLDRASASGGKKVRTGSTFSEPAAAGDDTLQKFVFPNTHVDQTRERLSLTQPSKGTFLEARQTPTPVDETGESWVAKQFWNAPLTKLMGRAAAFVRRGSTEEPRRGRIVVVAIVSVVVFVLLVLLAAFFIALWFTGRILRRQASFWWQVGPVLLAYRWSIRKLQLYGGLQDGEEDKALTALHVQYAPKALEIVQSLGGMFLKMAQVAANNPMIPIEYRREFSKCMDHNIPMDFQYVRAEVEAALRASKPGAARKIEDVFSRFDREPLGVASIGQVHRAQVFESGKEVAIKVKFPEVEQLFMADFASLKVLARFARCSWAVPLIEEFSRSIAQEFNYVQEAVNIDTIREVLMPRFEDKVEIPRVCATYSTDSVLTMTFAEGTRLDTALKERLRQVGLDAARLERAMALEGGPGGQLLPGMCPSPGQEAPNTGRMRRVSDRTSGLMLDVLLAGLRLKSCVDGCFRGLRRDHHPAGSSEAEEVLAQADVKSVMATLLELWGYSILEVGTFHGDPHPGNVLLQPGGQIKLLDFGQVKTLPPNVQQDFAELVLAVADMDKERIVEKVRQLGFELEAEEPEEGQPRPEDVPEVELAETIFGGAALPGMLMRMRVMRSVRQAPPDLFFVIRCAVILRGVGFGLGQKVNLAKAWRPHAEAHLRSLENPQETSREPFLQDGSTTVDNDAEEMAMAGGS